MDKYDAREELIDSLNRTIIGLKGVCVHEEEVYILEFLSQVHPGSTWGKYIFYIEVFISL
jgi:hypothetical protein